MAVDTRNKRASCIGFAGGYRQVWPNPDGTIVLIDRQQIAYSYPGISTEIIISPKVFFTGNIQRNSVLAALAQRNISTTSNAQRKVELTGDRGSNAL